MKFQKAYAEHQRRVSAVGKGEYTYTYFDDNGDLCEATINVQERIQSALPLTSFKDKIANGENINETSGFYADITRFQDKTAAEVLDNLALNTNKLLAQVAAAQKADGGSATVETADGEEENNSNEEL